MSSTLFQILELISREWINLYRKRPLLTAILTVIVFASSVSIVYVTEKIDAERREQKRLENFSFLDQIEQLNKTEVNLKELIEFVESQRLQLRQSQDALDSLNKEKEQLQPLVEADRKVVEALFEAQAQRSQDKVWTERWIGFGFGILSSIVGAIVVTIASILWKERNKVSLLNQGENSSQDNH